MIQGKLNSPIDIGGVFDVMNRTLGKIEDLSLFHEKLLASRIELGFTGKVLIHPNQINVVHECFAPSHMQIEHARRVVEAFDKAQAEGHGSITVAGQLVDLPIVEKARRVLELQRKLGS